MDETVIKELSLLCEFTFKMNEEKCIEISFFDPHSIFEGTIRHADKPKILNLVRQLTHLQKLDLRKCRVEEIPDFNIPNVEYLDLSCNSLARVPPWVYELKKLRYLNLGSNNIEILSSIPPTVETLKLHKNKIKELPVIPNTVRFLNLYLNQIPQLPKLDLPLEFLSFGVTKMEALPSLPKTLRWLSLVANHITKLPDDFCDLSNLEGLRLAKNKLNSLPADIGKMNIKEITLYQNNLRCLPESFYDLKLRKLNLSKNPLIETEKIHETFSGIEFFECDLC